jgi:hypothetical protein
MLYSIEVDGIGRMSHQGRSKHWTGEVRLAGVDEPVEVPAESYDPNAIHVLVGLEHVDYPDDFRSAIDVVNGSVVQVLSGT